MSSSLCPRPRPRPLILRGLSSSSSSYLVLLVVKSNLVLHLRVLHSKLPANRLKQLPHRRRALRLGHLLRSRETLPMAARRRHVPQPEVFKNWF